MKGAAVSLIETWRTRDHRYAKRKLNGRFVPLSEVEERAVREWRGLEVEALSVEDQARPAEVLRVWRPPNAVA